MESSDTANSTASSAASTRPRSFSWRRISRWRSPGRASVAVFMIVHNHARLGIIRQALIGVKTLHFSTWVAAGVPDTPALSCVALHEGMQGVEPMEQTDEHKRSAVSRREAVGLLGVGMTSAIAGPAFAQGAAGAQTNTGGSQPNMQD